MSCKHVLDHVSDGKEISTFRLVEYKFEYDFFFKNKNNNES